MTEDEPLGAAAGELYPTQEVADHLGLHVRTVRRYVREGRLPAVKIGKQYRIAPEDLEALTGRPPPAASTRARSAQASEPALHVDVSTILTAQPLQPETAARLTRTLLAAVRGAARRRSPSGSTRCTTRSARVSSWSPRAASRRPRSCWA